MACACAREAAHACAREAAHALWGSPQWGGAPPLSKLEMDFERRSMSVSEEGEGTEGEGTGGEAGGEAE